MNIKKKGFVSVENIYDSSDEAFEYRGPVVEVEYEIDAPELDMLQAAAVIAKGGKVRWTRNAAGQPMDGWTYPTNQGSVLLLVGAKYVEVPR